MMKEGWEIKMLGDICKSDLGKTLNSSKDLGELKPYLCAINIHWDEVDTSFLKTARFDSNELERYSVHKGDLLVCEGGDAGRAAIWDRDEPILYQNALHRLRFIKGYNNRFYMYLLYHLKQIGTIDEKYAKGVTIKHLVKKSLLSIPIPVPPLSEQSHIVAELDLLSSVIEKKKKQLEELDNLAQAIFYEMFGDPIANDKGWEMATLANVSLGKGSYGAGSSSMPKDENRPRYIRITDIDDLGELNDDYVVSSNKEDDDTYRLQYGDLLFARSGATVGKTYLYKGQEPQIYAGYLIKFSLNQNFINPYFAFYITRGKSYKTWLQSQISGAAQPNVNAKKYGSLSIILPPLSLQQQFSDHIAAIEQQKTKIKQSLAEAETLLASRMSYYFD